MDLFTRKLIENGGICANCVKNVGEVYETFKERIKSGSWRSWSWN